MTRWIIAAILLAGMLLAAGIWLSMRDKPALTQTTRMTPVAKDQETGTTAAAEAPPAAIPHAQADVRQPAPRDPGEAMSRWLAGYRAAAPAAQTAMQADGIRLATERRVWLLDLIQRDPQAALAAAFSASDLAALPPSIAELAEKRIDQTGFFGVLAICNHGPDAPHGEGCRIEREVRLGDPPSASRLIAHTYGRGMDRLTAMNDRIVGIELDGHIAVAEPDAVQP
jgi:hypothetical protein